MIWAIFTKSVKEQLRNFWILVLTVSMAPFFVFVYFLINEASQPHFNVLVLNHDQGHIYENEVINLGETAAPELKKLASDIDNVPLTIKAIESREKAIYEIETRAAEALLVVPAGFTQALLVDSIVVPEMEFVGDLTNTGYLISAVWLGELLSGYIGDTTPYTPAFTVRETAVGHSGQIDAFELYMPGMLVLSIIMLMFSATVAIITEVDQGTILRLKLSGMKAWHFLVGVGSTQVLVGFAAVLFTLGSAILLGFEVRGSLALFFLIILLTSISMIAFSLILAAVTRSVTDVLVIGNFPLFLFMFFSGAAFPISATSWFQIGDYGVSWQSLMSAAPAISALQKISIMGLGLNEIWGELFTLMSMTIVYFLLGLWGFNRRHLRTK
mgnify:CR=1 FL=1